MLNQDQLQRNNPKQICKRFIIYFWSHVTNSNAFFYREKDDKNCTNSSTEAEQNYQEAGPAPKNKYKTKM